MFDYRVDNRYTTLTGNVKRFFEGSLKGLEQQVAASNPQPHAAIL